MEVNVKVIQVMPVESGVGKQSGKQWSKCTFIGETFDQYPKKIACSIFNPGQNVVIPDVGEMITASFDLESRSFISKAGTEMWSTEVRIWKIVPYDPTANVPSFAPQQPSPQMQPQQQAYAPQQPQQPYAPQGQFAPQQAPQFAAPQYQAPQQPAPSNDLPF